MESWKEKGYQKLGIKEEQLLYFVGSYNFLDLS
jgi:hypothetical protein